jgi:DNA-binding transcriptional LysR family regulator
MPKFRKDAAERPDKIDLNLLAVFDAIMVEGSLRGASVRLKMNQPAVSQAVTRLRKVVGDKLFERKGRGVVPTARAQEMARNIRPAMDLMRSALASADAFEPQSESRTFLLDVPAGIDALTAPLLAKRLHEAPGLNFNIASAPASRMATELRFGETHIALDYEPMIAEGYRSELLYKDHFVVLSRADHPELVDGLGIMKYQRLGHVAVSWGSGRKSSPLVQKLTSATISRNVRMTVPNLPSMLRVVAESDLLGSTWNKVALRSLSQVAGLRVHQMPFEMPPVPIFMVWHETFDNDAGHSWLRDVLRDIYRAL